MFDESKLPPMLAKAAELLAASGASSFCISSIVPEKWLIEEEKKFDFSLEGAQSIKNYLNRRIAKELSSSGKQYSGEGEVRITLDFNNFSVRMSSENIFIFGRYEKHSRELSQSRWACQKCNGEGCFKCHYEGKNYVSIEELIGNVFRKHSDCVDYSLHASGREDVDVINTAGRPFVLELKEPQKLLFSLDEIAEEIAKDGRVKVRDLRFVPRAFVEIVSNSHFDKEYEALVEFSKPASKEAIAALDNANFALSQHTPTRVMHRRSDLERKRHVKHIKLLAAEDGKMRIRICAEPGTYIKEFVSGDGGRTKPSISYILGVEAKCVSLDVVKIHDEFLGLVTYQIPISD